MYQINLNSVILDKDMVRTLFRSLRFALAICLIVQVHAQETIRVAAAADLQVVLPVLAGRFQTATGVQIVPSFGSSGTLSAQIQNGAPFDAFLSADVEYPRLLAQRGLADPSAVVTYARGRIVLWTRKDSGIDIVAGLKALTVPAIRRIAIANPEHAPYGRAAVAALRHEGVYEAVRAKLVMGENVSQTAQFARTGDAEVAIIALALAVGPVLSEVGRHVEIPASFHPAIDQGAVWLKGSKNPGAAKRFVDFLQQPASVAYLSSMGFEPVK
jgi:molybdate transport system substrate-binding protein